MWIPILVGLFVGYATWRLALGYRFPRERYANLAPREAAFLEAAAEAMFPSGGAIPLAGRDADLPAYADRWFAALHPTKRFQIRMLLLFFEQATIFWPAPRPRGFRRFSSLSLEQRVAVLSSWTESRWFVRRLVFTALRAVLTMGYLGHPAAMRHLRIAPYELDTPVCKADLLYPPIGRGPEEIAYGAGDLTPPSDGVPLDIDGPIRSDYRETPL